MVYDFPNWRGGAVEDHVGYYISKDPVHTSILEQLQDGPGLLCSTLEESTDLLLFDEIDELGLATEAGELKRFANLLREERLGVRTRAQHDDVAARTTRLTRSMVTAAPGACESFGCTAAFQRATTASSKPQQHWDNVCVRLAAVYGNARVRLTR